MHLILTGNDHCLHLKSSTLVIKTMQHQVIYIMGVSGSGKTTIGQLLADKTGYPFYDADDFHPIENITKMNAGIPLTDEDRKPWLHNIHDFVSEHIKMNHLVFVCSALKQVYRNRLSQSMEANCRWIYLEGNYETILLRLKNRQGHYMPPTLLQSQFDALEIPADATRIDIEQEPEKIVELIITEIKK